MANTAPKKYFKLNQKNNTITIDTTVIPTTAEKDVVEMYVKAGYVVRFKSEARAKAARERAKNNGFGKKKEEAKEEATEN